jgi:hypothetical protein
LKWDQVHAWRLSQQFLQNPANRKDLEAVVTRIGGVQAQLMAAAEMSLAVRVKDLKPADVQNALWREHSLLKTWAMRGTLHLLAAGEFPLFVAARAAHSPLRPPSYFRYHGVTPAELDAIIEGVPAVLSGKPMTRAQLADALAKLSRKPNLRKVLLSGWGALLKPSASRGDLCFGPNQGQNVTFVRPREWIGEWQALEPQAAVAEMARRYLRAFGPASAEDFARWWGIQPGPAKRVFRSLENEIEPVEVEGWQAWALSATLQRMKKMKPPKAVRLLPQFDAYTLGVSRDCDPVLPREHRGRVYRPQGWIAAVVLVDGRMAGTWTYEGRGPKIELNVEMFAGPTAAVKRGVVAEAKRLAEFLEAEVSVAFGTG